MTIVPAPSPYPSPSLEAEGPKPARSPREPIQVCAPGVDAATSTAAGVVTSQPRAIRRPAMSWRDRRPIMTTMVAECGGSASSTGRPRALIVPGDRHEGGCGTAMRHRDPGQRGRGDRRGDARHDLERDAGRVERQGFFATAPEHERVARLQPHHAPATARGANQEPVDRRPGSSRAGRLACRRRNAARAVPAPARPARRARRTARVLHARACRRRHA